MKWIQIILAEHIRRGTVTLEVPGVDTDRLLKEMHNKADRLLCDVINIVCDEDLTDREKVVEVQKVVL